MSKPCPIRIQGFDLLFGQRYATWRIGHVPDAYLACIRVSKCPTHGHSLMLPYPCFTCWNPLLSKPFNGWEMGEVDSFLLCLSWKKCNQAWKKRCFGGKKEADCFLLSLFLKLWNQNLPTLPQQISFGDPRCSLEAVSFLRKQSGEKFNPIQASKKGRSLVKRCFLCQTNEKSIDHISLNRVKTRVLSCYFLSLV